MFTIGVQHNVAARILDPSVLDFSQLRVSNVHEMVFDENKKEPTKRTDQMVAIMDTTMIIVCILGAIVS